MGKPLNETAKFVKDELKKKYKSSKDETEKARILRRLERIALGEMGLKRSLKIHAADETPAPATPAPVVETPKVIDPLRFHPNPVYPYPCRSAIDGAPPFCNHSECRRSGQSESATPAPLVAETPKIEPKAAPTPAPTVHTPKQIAPAPKKPIQANWKAFARGTPELRRATMMHESFWTEFFKLHTETRQFMLDFEKDVYEAYMSRRRDNPPKPAPNGGLEMTKFTEAQLDEINKPPEMRIYEQPAETIPVLKARNEFIDGGTFNSSCELDITPQPDMNRRHD